MPQRLRIPLTSAALVIATMAVAVTISASPAGAVTNCTPSAAWGTNRTDLAAQVVQLINEHRAGRGLSQLALSSPLSAAATWKSLHMAGYAYFAHDDPAPPVARTAHGRAIDCGYGGGPWGENIAWGYTSPQSVVNGWLGSSGHKANIENPSFTSTGVGVAANANGSLYWTQEFGNDVPAAGPPPPPAPAPTPPPPAPAPPPPPPAAPPSPAATTPPSSPAQATDPSSGTVPTEPLPAVVDAAPAPVAGSEPAPGTLAVGGMPARVVNGKHRSKLHASVSFVNLADGKPFATGSVRCRAEVNGRRLRVVANVFKGDAASCAWRIPRWARGKQLTGVVAVQVDDASATRLFIRRVR